jgi:itaconate CoA-transferase
LCREVLGRPELVEDPRCARNTERVANNDMITDVIETVLARRLADDVVSELERRGLACARTRTPQEFYDHPQLAARNRWREVDSPGGRVRALLPPVLMEGREAAMGDVPSLGQHSAALRREFGVSSGDEAR